MIKPLKSKYNWTLYYSIFIMRKLKLTVIIVTLIIINLLSSCSRNYHIEIVDENGYLIDYWESVYEYSILDSIISINEGMFTYRLQPGDKLNINYDNTYRF